MRIVKMIGLFTFAFVLFNPMVAKAEDEDTVQCVSNGANYTECYAVMLEQPQLIYQISSSACILNRTWGFNPRSGYIWVANGCSGVFADMSGYHHGRGDTYDEGARHYDHRGHDAGKVAAGVVLGAILSAALEPKSHTTSNVRPYPREKRHSICHGTGCTVDKPVQPRVQPSNNGTGRFDREGNPNFDTQGRYQGCHGIGCLVDSPDR